MYLAYSLTKSVTKSIRRRIARFISRQSVRDRYETIKQVQDDATAHNSSGDRTAVGTPRFYVNNFDDDDDEMDSCASVRSSSVWLADVVDDIADFDVDGSAGDLDDLAKCSSPNGKVVVNKLVAGIIETVISKQSKQPTVKTAEGMRNTDISGTVDADILKKEQ
ncbi:hypothetical protein CYMTET_50212 [Cymbomonas tetramitiformis]|uniref:Uncharacterized protein n=1 Tax=Cymbomonas tetramitiformis TaxID=36881 RepID=A0AAE0BQI1_9CHLO|nr:hypothetical protein CYMTET_50212 [Cymbomonas tetramitiformis]